MSYELIELIAIIMVCFVLIIRPVLARFLPSAAVKFNKFYPYAMQAFAYVEKSISDDYGLEENDPVFAKMAHKSDLFLKKFLDFSTIATGEKPNAKMLEEAKKLAAALAFKGKKK